MTPFFMAWMMFCSIPCPVKKWDQSKTDQMLMCLPGIGLIIGAIWFGIYKAFAALRIGLIGSAVICVIPWLLTGFMHLDGYMDCADAVLSFKDREERIRILKDSRVGSFAVICMAILSVFTFASWLQVGYSTSGLVMIFIPVASRAVSAACVLGFEPLATSQYAEGRDTKKPAWMIAVCVGIAVIACILGFVLGGLEGIAVLASAVCTLLTILKVRANLGGMSGDISGCGISTGECCAVIALAIAAAFA